MSDYEAAHTRAVEVVGEHRGHETPFDGSWVVRCNCGWDSSETILTYALKEHDEHVVHALRAAHTDCKTCAGDGGVYYGSGENEGREPCPACDGSGRGESVLVAMMMERARVAGTIFLTLTGRTQSDGSDMDENVWQDCLNAADAIMRGLSQ